MLLSACGRTHTEVLTTTNNVYPDLPHIDKPIELDLEAVAYAFPLDMNAPPVIKSSTFCKSTPVEEQDLNYEAKCFEQPVDKDSNVYIGFEQNEWEKFKTNMVKLKAQGEAYSDTIDEINRQRDVWKKLNNQQEK